MKKSFKLVNATRVFSFLDKTPENEKFFFIFRSYDIPNTIEAMLKGLPDNCIGFSVNYRGGPEMIKRALRVARKRNMIMLITGY